MSMPRKRQLRAVIGKHTSNRQYDPHEPLRIYEVLGQACWHGRCTAASNTLESLLNSGPLTRSSRHRDT
jgi:hypothetical protein